MQHRYRHSAARGVTRAPKSDSPISASTYWKTQSECYELWDHSGFDGSGDCVGLKRGDILHRTGTAGNYHYTLPNTAAYKAKDTDYAWFKTDESVSDMTSARLVGYDLQRTITKYDDDSPNTERWTMILNSAVTGDKLNKMFNDFHLPVLWNNSLNAYGRIKSNRIGQNLWTPESITPATISDTNKTVAWFTSDDLATITKDAGTGEVSQWNDKNGTGVNLLDPGATKRPIWSANGILFDGGNDSMKATFTWNQPCFIYMVVKQVTWTTLDFFFYGNAYAAPNLWQRNLSGQIQAVGNGDANKYTDYGSLALDTWGIVRVLFSGASSKLTVNGNAPITADLGTNAMAGFTLGASYAQNTRFGNIAVKEIILRKVADGVEDEAAIYNYLKNKYSL